MSKVVAIHQPQYVPYLGFFHKLQQCDLFVILDNIQFQKNGLQNRNKIKSHHGWQWLTVPVLHRLGQAICEVRLDRRQRWQKKHWNALVTNYSRAPYFHQYADGIRHLLEQDWEYLSQLDVALIKWAMEALQITTPLLYASELNVTGQRTELLINVCRAVGANAYLSGPGGRRYMELEKFNSAGIRVLWQAVPSPVYRQMFPEAGFIADLSIVDVLFCCGAMARQWVRSAATSGASPVVSHQANEGEASADIQLMGESQVAGADSSKFV